MFSSLPRRVPCRATQSAPAVAIRRGCCYSFPMNHKELISALAEASKTDSKTASAVLSALTDLLLERVGAGEVVTIPRLAKFSLVDRAARVGRNPQTGEQLAIPAKRVAKITPTKTYKELAQRPL
jgi:DNA-binding protein HU-beta